MCQLLQSYLLAVVDPGEGPLGGGGDPLPPLVLDQTEARRAGKKCFWRPAPTFLRVWMTEPLPPLPQGLDPALH